MTFEPWGESDEITITKPEIACTLVALLVFVFAVQFWWEVLQ